MFENAAQPTSAQSVVVETRDVFSRHAEELVRARYAPEMANRGFTWPATGVTPEDFRDREVIVARVDGVVAGRAILDAVFYPLAELENLEVAPAYRGRGVGAAIVGQAIETAARAGFLAIHAQTRCDNVAAHRVYAHQGFLPATRGEMLRAWRFLNLPALAQFLYDHPFALFDSRPGAGAREHILRWREPAGEDELAVTLTGGSCQRDSGGVGPGVGAVRLRSGPVCLTATAEGTATPRVEEAFPVRLTLVNEGEGELSGGFRLGLNAGFKISGEHSGGERFSLAAGDDLDRTLTIEIEPSFPAAVLGICAYPSVPVTVEFLLGDHTFWLAAQVQIEEGGR